MKPLRTLLLAALFAPVALAQTQSIGPGSQIGLQSVEQDWVASRGGFLSVGVVTTDDGFIYVSGRSDLNAGNGFRSDIVTIKYDLDGNEVWVREFDETDDGTNGTDRPRWIALDPFGNVIVTGESFINQTGDDIITLKYDPSGNLLWKVRATSGLLASRVATDAAGNIYVAGVTSTVPSGADFITIKYDPDGNELWTQINPGGFGDAVHGLVVTDTGESVVVGESSNGTSCYDATTIFYEPDGTQRWMQTYTSPITCGLDAGSDIAFGANGEVYVVGHVETEDGLDFLLIRYDSAGNEVWVREPVISGTQLAARVMVDSQGDIVFTGATTSPSDIMTLKYDANGNQIWEASVDISGEDIPRNMAIGPDDAVYITGYATIASLSMSTAKLDADGILQWTATHDEPVSADVGYGIALDNTGNVIVTGSSNILTIRYLQSGPPPADVLIELTPVNPPVSIPPEGGSFQYTVNLTNTSTTAQTFEFWTAISGPLNREPLLGPKTLTMAPGASFTRTLTQRIPHRVPGGSYTYIGNVGTFGVAVDASDSFSVSKKESPVAYDATTEGDIALSDLGDTDWSVYGWEDSPVAFVRPTAELSTNPSLFGAYPNPFNPSTTIHFNLPESAKVQLVVFNVLGSEVARLVDANLEAGQHEAHFDASGLPSGMYFARLTTGSGFAQAQRLTLLK